MRSHSQRNVGAALAVVALIASTISASAATPAAGGSRTVTPDGPASVRDGVTPLTGTDAYLVYSRVPTVTDAIFDRDDPPVPGPRGALVVRRASGSERTISTDVPAGIWSAAGSTVAVVDYDAHNVVETWDVGTGEHHRVTISPAGQVLGAAPHGFLDVVADQVLELRSVTGELVASGTPLPGQTLLSAVSNGERFVVSGSLGGVATATYAAPTDYQSLQSGSTTSVTCHALSTAGAACLSDSQQRLVLVRLDGAPPAVSANCSCSPGSVAISGGTLIFTDDSSDDTKLHRISATGTSTSSYYVDFRLASALGGAVFRKLGSSELSRLRLATANDVQFLFRASRSPETAGSFSLAGDRVLYVSDLRKQADPEQLTRLRSIPVRLRDGVVRLGDAKTLGGRQGRLQVHPSPYPAFGSESSFVGASGRASVYVLCSGRRCHPVVVTAARRVTLDLDVRQVAVSSSRVLLHADGWYVYDTETGQLRRVLRHLGASPQSVSISGSRLAYALGRRIFRLNLRTGRTELVYRYRPEGTVYGVQATVVSHSHWVAWDFDPGRPVEAANDDGVRNMRTGHLRKLPNQVYGIYERGVLMRDGSWTEGVTTTYAPFGGRVRPLLSTRLYDELPQVAGGVLAWVTAQGDLRLRPLRL